MFKKATIFCLSAALLLGAAPAASAAGLTLTEQYSFAGAINQWYAEESYYAAPLVTDLDGDGRLEVLLAAHALTVLDAATGEVKWRVNSGHDRSTPFDTYGNTSRQIFCDVQVMDVDGDGAKEIAVGYADGTVSLLSKDGYFKPGWPQRPVSDKEASVRSLVLADVDGDGKGEVIVGLGVADPTSVWVYRYDGAVQPGWPQLSREQNANFNTSVTGTAYSYGVFANGIAVGDLDGQPGLEIVVPTDSPYICAYHADGTLVTAHPQYASIGGQYGLGGVITPEGDRTWGKIALWESYDEEIACVNEGWGWAIKGGETRQQLYRAELGHSAAVISDVDGDGKNEVVVTALMTDRTTHTRTNHFTTADTRYMTAYILNADRSRYWATPPTDLGGPLKANDPLSVATGVLSEPVCADLDGDGRQEILFNSYNGKLHCFDLDQNQFGSWPFTLPQTRAGLYEYAATPVCADLDGDGKQEVIFASWLADDQGANTGVNGALYILDCNGNLLCSQPLHDGYATYEGVVHSSNNVFSAPAVQDVDGDGKFEILLNTSYYGLCCYEVNLPAAPQAKTAYASPTSIVVDGAPVSLTAYALKDAKGNLTNYLKLRDVASLLNGTQAQFQVGWDGSVNITTGAAYTPDGSEMSTPFTGDRAYEPSAAATRVNGEAVQLDAITLKDDAGNGYTYYKLRDLGQALGFNVTWDQSAQSIVVESWKD